MAKKAVPTTKSKQSKPRRASRANVEVKSYREVFKNINNFISRNLHDRYNIRYSEVTRLKLVSYGPWIMIGTLLFFAPELLVLAKDTMFISPAGFIEKVLFNRDSWVTLIIVLINIICAIDALSELFAKTKRGWNRVYLALLINTGYVLYQLSTNLQQPAAPLLALLGFIFCLFSVLDIREYYT